MRLRKDRLDEESRSRGRYLQAPKAAQRECDIARSHSGEAIEPEIIDESMFLMDAAKRKHLYFLWRVRDSYGQASRLI